MFKSITPRGTAAAAVALAGATLLAAAGPAAAAGNGQQIAFRDNSYSAHSIQIEGHNQNGYHVSQCFTVSPGGSTQISGWWWKGTVRVKSFNNGGCTGTTFRWSQDKYIPEQQSGDWVWFTGY
ncbi:MULTISPECIES: hypothetical protein [Streptomyces]|uniref:hypothetical protein n=1 Tax=Streptomyces TaxID=1883 RepID=UPI000F6EFECE|nr:MULTISPECIES: hypothetical protein [unclassified Streptomyces]AZM93612.1 hypothetical protein D1J60_34255 [Streptomyces sp. W1SF4]RSS58140.1 hypothetical protein EF912_11570 [Streptomyces sp. WAC07061]